MQNINLKDLLTKIRETDKDKNKETIIVGIDGCSAAGKTTLAKKLRELANDVKVISMDDFYMPTQYRSKTITKIAQDYDINRLLKQVFNPLSKSSNIIYASYNWEKDELNKEVYYLKRGGIIIVEGCYATCNELKDFYDYTIWIYTPTDIRLKRTIAKYGEAVKEFWENNQIPKEDYYIRVEKPASRANTVINGNQAYII